MGENIDDRVSATFTGLRLNRATRTFDTVGTLTNNASDGSVSTPLSLVITNISSPNVSVANASGLTPEAERPCDPPTRGGERCVCPVPILYTQRAPQALWQKGATCRVQELALPSGLPQERLWG